MHFVVTNYYAILWSTHQVICSLFNILFLSKLVQLVM